MSAPESLRDEVAAVLAEHAIVAAQQPRQGITQTVPELAVLCVVCGWMATSDHAAHLTDALLASPALARVIREKQAEAWDEGFGDGSRQDAEGDDGPQFSNPYREGGA